MTVFKVGSLISVSKWSSLRSSWFVDGGSNTVTLGSSRESLGLRSLLLGRWLGLRWWTLLDD